MLRRKLITDSPSPHSLSLYGKKSSVSILQSAFVLNEDRFFFLGWAEPFKPFKPETEREAVYYFVNQDTFVNDNSIKKAINSQRTLSLLPALQEDGDYCKTAEVSGFTEPI